MRRCARREGNAARRGLPGWLGTLLLALLLAAPDAARAVLVDFEEVASGTDTAAADLEGVTIAGGLVLDEATVSTLLGVPATGTWNTTPGGTKGVLNVLSPSLVIEFTTPVVSFGFSVLALPDAAGDDSSLLVLADDFFSQILEPGSLGDSGFPEHVFSFSAQPGVPISQVTLCVLNSIGDGCLDPGLPTTFWIDDLTFEPVPEPATSALLALGLAACAARRSSR
ncbi:MAG: PEP-CTERM sorting domain-containing protein [Actinobacteria bacterium]|nr:PEP-CTERM sorting domain-containing protein [Actinomycetota bacterium]